MLSLKWIVTKCTQLDLVRRAIGAGKFFFLSFVSLRLMS